MSSETWNLQDLLGRADGPVHTSSASRHRLLSEEFAEFATEFDLSPEAIPAVLKTWKATAEGGPLRMDGRGRYADAPRPSMLTRIRLALWHRRAPEAAPPSGTRLAGGH
jgi:hypothetical protein